MTARPVWMLDIDGVLNVFQPSWGIDLTRVKVGFPIRYNQPLIDRIRAIHTSGLAEVRWSTTWCGYRDQLVWLGRLFDLDLTRAFGDRPMSKTWADLKVEAALAVLAEGRRLIWTDDGEVEAGRRLFPALAHAEADGRALLIEPDSVIGLQADHMDQIEAFTAAVPVGAVSTRRPDEPFPSAFKVTDRTVAPEMTVTLNRERPARAARVSPCCEFHNQNCEPPGDLCCHDCTEARHPVHPNGVTCVLEDR